MSNEGEAGSKEAEGTVKQEEQGLNATQLKQIGDIFKQNVGTDSSEKKETRKSILNELDEEEQAKLKAVEVDARADERSDKRNEVLKIAEILGGKVAEVADKYILNYFSKEFKSPEIVAELTSDMLFTIVKDEQLSKFIPQWKEKNVADFINEPDEKKKIAKAGKLFEVVYDIMSNKNAVDKELASKKANEEKTTSSYGGGETLTIFDMQRESLKDGNGKYKSGNLI